LTDKLEICTYNTQLPGDNGSCANNSTHKRTYNQHSTKSEVYAMAHLHFNIYKVAKQREIDGSITLLSVCQSSNASNCYRS